MKQSRNALPYCAALYLAVGCNDLPSFPSDFGSSGGAGGVASSAGTTSAAGAVPVVAAGTNGGGMDTTGAGGSLGSAPLAGNASSGTATGGNSGNGVNGGAAGSASAGTGGMAGAAPNPQAEIDDAVKSLKGFRYENLCGYVDGHSLTDGQCNSGEICWHDPNKGRFAEKRVIQIGGVVGHQYDVTLRIRGAIEPRDYPSSCTFIPGGAPNQATIGIIENCDGFANSGQVTYNVYQFAIQEPKHVYYFNAVKVHPPHRVDVIDQTWTIRVAGGTKINFDFDDLNGGEIRNCDIALSGVAPYPKAFDGNFFQLDVVDAKLVP